MGGYTKTYAVNRRQYRAFGQGLGRIIESIKTTKKIIT